MSTPIENNTTSLEALYSEVESLPSRGASLQPSKAVTVTANGTSTITPDTGYDAMEEEALTVNVPTPTPTLITKNITANGTYNASADNADGYSQVAVSVPVPQSETKSVALSMVSGNQVIDATSGKLMSQVTVQKPSTLIPANIKKDVNIGGVVGDFEGGGVADVRITASTLYFAYNVKIIKPDGTTTEFGLSSSAIVPVGSLCIASATNSAFQNNYRWCYDSGLQIPTAINLTVSGTYYLIMSAIANAKIAMPYIP